MSTEEIDQHFPASDASKVDSHANSTATPNSQNINNEELNADVNLDRKLQYLRDQLQKQQEINELRKHISALNSNDRASSSTFQCFNFRDVEESLNTFNGDDKYKICNWVQHFEETANILGWSDTARLV